MSKAKWFVVRKPDDCHISQSDCAARSSVVVQNCCAIFTRLSFPLWRIGRGVWASGHLGVWASGFETSTIIDICATNSLHLISPAGSDYTPVTTDLTFNSTNAAIPQTVTIPILDDLLLEGSENFGLILTTNNSNVTFLPSLATVTIQDWECKFKK